MEFEIKNKTNKWPLSLKNFSFLNIKSDSCSIYSNSKNLNRDWIFKKTKKGFIYLDKPSGWNSYEISLWIKNSLNLEKTKSLEKMGSNLSGCILISFNSKLTIKKTIFETKKDYICVFKLKNFNSFENINFRKLSTVLNGHVFHLQNFFLNIKSNLKSKNKFSSYLVEIDKKKTLGILEISCESNLYSPFLFFNMGFILGESVNLLELRKIRFGNLTEEENLTTLHDLIDAKWIENCLKNNFLFQKVLSPFEILLSFYKRIIVKNSCINSLCYGAKLTISGILRFEKNIEKEENIILISIKGEVIALGRSKTNTKSIFCIIEGIVAKIEYIFMEKDFYPKKWGFGMISTKKNILNSAGIQNYYKKKKAVSSKWWIKRKNH